MVFSLALVGAQGSRWAFYQNVFYATAAYGALSALVSAIARQRFSCSLGVVLCGVSLLGSHVISQLLKETQQAKKGQDPKEPPLTSPPPLPVAETTANKVTKVASPIETAAPLAGDSQGLPKIVIELPRSEPSTHRQSIEVSPISISEPKDSNPLEAAAKASSVAGGEDLSVSTLLLSKSTIAEADEARLADENDHGVVSLSDSDPMNSSHTSDK